MNRWTLGALVVASVLNGRFASAQEDPAAPGPHAFTISAYGSSTTLVKDVSSFDVNNETLAQVVYPTDVGNGPYPLVFFLHGRHFNCVTLFEASAWPCTGDAEPWPSHEGYVDAASVLARHGLIVVSISAHGLSSTSTPGTGYESLLQYHMSQWQALNTGAIALSNGQTFTGKVDLARIGLMGHSRGGEGVLDYAATSPAGLKAVMAIAPTSVASTTPINNVPVGIMLAYCDGDTEDLGGVGYVDSTRYNSAADNNPKYTIISLGANHSNFNSAWTPGFGLDRVLGLNEDDWDSKMDPSDPHCGSGSAGRNTDAEQRGFRTAYLAAFLRRYLLGATQFDPLLKGEQIPSSALTDDIYIGYLPGAEDRKDLNRQTSSADLSTNALSGAVTFTGGLTKSVCTGSGCRPGVARTTHFGGASALRVSWSTSGQSFSNALPRSKGDVSNFSTLQFRVAVGVNGTALPMDFSVQLVDGAGQSQKVRVRDYTEVLYDAPGASANRALVMNTVRVPIAAFGNVDTTNVSSVDVIFDQSASGTLLIADLAFSDESMTIAEKWMAAVVF